MEQLPVALSVIAGLVLLFAGRRFFWLAAALTAFLFAFQLLQKVAGNGLVSLGVAAVLGLIIVGLAVQFVKFIGFALGALAGAAGLPILLGLLGISASWWILALVGAVIGIMIISLAFQLGLVLMTAWVGANALAGAAGQTLMPGAGVSGALFVILFIAGVVVQLGLFGKKKQA